MLHKDTFIIAPATLNLIVELQQMPELAKFNLVGGTALALQLGHRTSIDIDLFSNSDFEEGELVKLLGEKFDYKELYRRTQTIICLLNNIKTDFLKHDYPLLHPPVTEQGIRFLSNEDIAAMKLHAIIQSGKRFKDFIDIYFLLEHYSMNEMLEFFITKYSYSNQMLALKAVNFFGDIDMDIDPPNLLKPLPLKKIEKRIQEATLHPARKFSV